MTRLLLAVRGLGQSLAVVAGIALLGVALVVLIGFPS